MLKIVNLTRLIHIFYAVCFVWITFIRPYNLKAVCREVAKFRDIVMINIVSPVCFSFPQSQMFQDIKFEFFEPPQIAVYLRSWEFCSRIVQKFRAK